MGGVTEPASAVYNRDLVNAATVIRARAPLRISFVGGGTDLPHYYERHGGAVLSRTINRYVSATLRPRGDDTIQINALDLGYSAAYRLGDSVKSGGLFDLVMTAIQRIGGEKGFELDLHSQAPRGSGLGGSSAVTAAILGTIIEYLGMVLDHYDLAELNYTIERIDLGIAGGKQDQYATTFGGFNIIEFWKDRVSVTPLRLPNDVLNDLEDHLTLYYTGKVRPSLGIVEKRVEAYERGDHSVREGMSRLHEMVYEAKEALLKGRIREFGALLHENMVNKKSSTLMSAHHTSTNSTKAPENLARLAESCSALVAAATFFSWSRGGVSLKCVQSWRRPARSTPISRSKVRDCRFGEAVASERSSSTGSHSVRRAWHKASECPPGPPQGPGRGVRPAVSGLPPGPVGQCRRGTRHSGDRVSWGAGSRYLSAVLSRFALKLFTRGRSVRYGRRFAFGGIEFATGSRNEWRLLL